MSSLHSSEQPEHCFARLKARTLTAEEVDSISGGFSSSVTAGETGIIVLFDDYFGDDGSVD